MKNIIRTVCLVLGIAFCVGTANAGVRFLSDWGQNIFAQDEYEGVADCPATYTETCEAPAIGVGTACNGNYQSCACPPAFAYEIDVDCPNPLVVDKDSSSCLGKFYTSCKCPASYKACLGVPRSGAIACDGKYLGTDCITCDQSWFTSSTCASPKVLGGGSCQDEGQPTLRETCSCPATYLTCSNGGDIGAQSCTDGQGTKFSACKPDCPAGYSTSITSCGTGYTLQTNGKCGKCTETACPDGYSTEVTSCEIGYALSVDGQSGTQTCGMCESDGSIECAEQGYDINLATWSGPGEPCDTNPGADGLNVMEYCYANGRLYDYGKCKRSCGGIAIDLGFVAAPTINPDGSLWWNPNTREAIAMSYVTIPTFNAPDGEKFSSIKSLARYAKEQGMTDEQISGCNLVTYLTLENPSSSEYLEIGGVDLESIFLRLRYKHNNTVGYKISSPTNWDGIVVDRYYSESSCHAQFAGSDTDFVSACPRLLVESDLLLNGGISGRTFITEITAGGKIQIIAGSGFSGETPAILVSGGYFIIDGVPMSPWMGYNILLENGGKLIVKGGAEAYIAAVSIAGVKVYNDTLKPRGEWDVIVTENSKLRIDNPVSYSGSLNLRRAKVKVEDGSTLSLTDGRYMACGGYMICVSSSSTFKVNTTSYSGSYRQYGSKTYSALNSSEAYCSNAGATGTTGFAWDSSADQEARCLYQNNDIWAP